MNKEIVEARKQNMRLYSFYRTISLDRIFFYAIEFLFLTQLKDITASQFVLGSSFYALFMIFMQIPASILVDKLGARKCTIISNIFGTLFVILVMNCNGFISYVFAQFIDSLCFSIKDISDDVLIMYSIPDGKNKSDIFSKLEGKGYRNYFFVNAITAVLSGFLYVLNPYIPMILSLIFHIMSIILALGFKDIEKIESSNSIKQNKVQKHYINELKEGIQFILKSNRLRSLFIYTGITWGIFCLISSYRSSILVDIGTPTPIITATTAIVGIASSFGSKSQLAFNARFKNKSLSIILLTTTISIIIAGICVVLNASYLVSLLVVTFSCIVINFNKGMSMVLSNRYLGNFSNENILSQIHAINAMVKNLIRASIGFVGSYLLDITNTANATILVGIFMIIISISLISYMKTRLGLKPEEYGKDDIFAL